MLIWVPVSLSFNKIIDNGKIQTLWWFVKEEKLMQIRHISIKNFRGIQKMDWALHSQIVCLVGAGDSTKSTILDAIEYALSPR
jgi:AAA ATPase domain